MNYRILYCSLRRSLQLATGSFNNICYFCLKPRVLLFLLLLFSTVSVLSNPLAKIYSHDNDIYRHIERLSIESGILPPSSASPWSGHELLSHLNKIDINTLSEQSIAKYKELKSKLNAENNIRWYNMQSRVSPELYFNVNNQHENPERDWEYDHHQRQSIAYADAETVIGNHLYGVFSIEMINRLNYVYPENNSNNISFAHIHTNLLTEGKGYDDTFPHTAFIGLSSENMSFKIGRGTQSWGRGKSGNLFIGDHAAYHDFLMFSANNDFFTYRFAAMHLNFLSEKGNPVRINFSNGVRLFVAHRAELRLHPRLLIAITEGALFNSEHLDMRMFSPVMHIHNYYNYHETKNTMQIELEYLLRPGIYCYSQVLIDQIQTPHEVRTYDECNLFPNAFGALLGLQFTKPVGEGHLSGYIESVFTSTYLYLRRNDLSLENSDACEGYRYFRDNYNLDYVQAYDFQGTSFIGYKHGPDTFRNTIHAAFEKDQQYQVFGEIIFSMSGEKGLSSEGKDQIVDTGMLYLNQFFPSGTIEYSLITGFGGKVWLKRLPISVFSQIHGINKWNHRNIPNAHFFDMQLVIGMEASISIL